MEEITQIIDNVAQGHKPDEQLNSILMDKVRDSLDLKKIEVANKIYNQAAENSADKN